jgi:hypothetical protein
MHGPALDSSRVHQGGGVKGMREGPPPAGARGPEWTERGAARRRGAAARPPAAPDKRRAGPPARRRGWAWGGAQPPKIAQRATRLWRGVRGVRGAGRPAGPAQCGPPSRSLDIGPGRAAHTWAPAAAGRRGEARRGAAAWRPHKTTGSHTSQARGRARACAPGSCRARPLARRRSGGLGGAGGAGSGIEVGLARRGGCSSGAHAARGSN